MTALTIDIDDRLTEALREAAARRPTTVDAIVAECLWQAIERDDLGGMPLSLSMPAVSPHQPSRSLDRGAPPGGWTLR